MPEYGKEEVHTSGIDIDTIIAKIREEVASRGKQASGYRTSSEDVKTASHGEALLANSVAIKSIIASAEIYSDVGVQIPPMVRFHGITRRLAILAGKIVLYVSTFITEKQRNFNRTVISSLRVMAESIERINTQVMRNIERRVKSETESLRNEMGEHEIMRQERSAALEAVITEQGKVIDALKKELEAIVAQQREQKNRNS